jgi:hypothetical protein
MSEKVATLHRVDSTQNAAVLVAHKASGEVQSFRINGKYFDGVTRAASIGHP